MKKLLIGFFLLVNAIAAKAQDVIHPTVLRFQTYYQSNQPDSIYNLFDAQMKAAVNLQATEGMVNQLKSQLGALVKLNKNVSEVPNVEKYRLSFERPLVEFVLYVKDDLIAGIKQVAVENTNQKVNNASPDNYKLSRSGDLYGTLKIPKTSGKVPVVLMIAGSGPTDRNMNQGNTLVSNSFLMLSDSLAKYGIATVRYDKRGIGKSMSAAGAEILFDEYIEDAAGFIQKLSEDSRFSKVIVLGHSEGSIIGIAAASRTPAAAFISIGGPADGYVAGLNTQLKKNLNASDYKIAAKVTSLLEQGKTTDEKLPKSIADLFLLPNQKFIISANKYVSYKEIKKLTIPVLIIAGTKDLQVGLDQAKHLHKENAKSQLKIITNMNHVLKTITGDEAANGASYNKPELPIHSDLSPAIVKFIAQLDSDVITAGKL
jgi:pimeloyl-ACP methyl ester carboxylesterase